MLRSILRILQEIVLPEFCINCKYAGGSLCPSCLKTISPDTNLKECIICENPVNSGNTHKKCLKDYPYSPVNFLYDYSYSGIVKKCIVASKSNKNCFKLLTLIMQKSNCIELLSGEPIDLIVPVPNSSRIFSRNSLSNPAVIAKFLSQILKLSDTSNKKSSIPIVNCLIKFPFSKKQSKIEKELRFDNAEKSMYFDLHYKEIIKNKKILLVDDVVTTGATLINASKLLMINMAGSVSAYSLARDFRYNASKGTVG